jgi:hypothetical protein
MTNVDAAENDAWHEGLAALRRYVEVRRTAALSTRARVEGFDLGEWVAHLRARYWAGTLQPNRVELLEALPGWRWSGVHQRQWLARLHALRRYVDRNGTAAVPPEVVVGKIRLGQWVAAQKARHAAGTLPRPIAELLEQVPGWHWEDQRQPEEERTRWTIVVDALRRQLSATDSETFDRASAEEFPLDQWIRRLRDDFRDGTLPTEVVAQLDTLPRWSWDPTQTSWERGLHALQAWLSDHGAASPPQDAVIDGFPIGRWVHARRREHRAGTLPSDKSVQLEALPGWEWNAWDAAWQHALRALQAYAEEHGTTRVPSSYAVGDIRLGQWAYHQRLSYRRGQLAPNRVAQLQTLPGWTWNAQRSPGKT